MGKYRKRPIVIEAVQLRWSQWPQVCEMLGDALLRDNPRGAYMIGADEASDTCGEDSARPDGVGYIALEVRTVHGDDATVRHGDWIVPDSKPGTFYPIKPDVFAATYDEVPE